MSDRVEKQLQKKEEAKNMIKSLTPDQKKEFVDLLESGNSAKQALDEVLKDIKK